MDEVKINVCHTTTIFTSDGDPVVVGEDDDDLGLVAVKCHTNYYGDLNFTMNPTTAKAVAEAILEQVKNIEGK